MAAAACNLLHLAFSQTPTFPFLRPSTRSLRPPPVTPLATGGPLRPALGDLAGPFDPTSPAAAIVDPALRHANVLFFSSGYNVQIVVGEEEPEEVLLRRFRREVSKAGVIQECKRRRFFENKQEERKRKVREASKRNRRRRSGPRFLSTSTTANRDAASKKAEDDLDDNWDLPEGDLPY